MNVTQDEYEQKVLEDLNAKLGELAKITAEIEKAANAQGPFPFNLKDILKKFAIATHACQEIINEHANGDRFSDAVLRSAALGLAQIEEAMNAVIFYAAIRDIVSRP